MVNLRTIRSPLLVFATLATGFAGLWFIDKQIQNRFLRVRTEFAAEEFGEDLAAAISDRIQSASSLRDVWVQGFSDVRREFESRATSMVNTFEGLRAINWINADGYIEWVAPAASNRAALGQNLFQHVVAGPYVRAADSTDLTRMTPPLQLFQGERGFAVYIPVRLEGRRLGFINVVFSATGLVATATGDDGFLRGFDLQLVARGSRLLEDSVDVSSHLAASAQHTIAGQPVTTYAVPHPRTVADSTSPLGKFILFGGLLISIAAALAVYRLRVSRYNLARTTEHLLATLDAVPDLHVVMDAETCVVDYRAPAGTLPDGTGDIRGRRVAEVFPASLAADIETAMSHVSASGEPATFEYSWARVDETRWYDTRIAPMKNDMFLLVARDITARRESERERSILETQMQRTQKLESLGLLAGGIAHDFNNILVSVLGNADMILEQVGRDSPLAPEVENIASAAERAAELCKQMLAYSGKGSLEKQPVDVSAVVSDVRQLVEVSLPKSVKIEYDLADHPGPVMADETQLRQVAMNMIVNAADAVEHRKGNVSVATGSLYCSPSGLEGTFLYGSPDEGEYTYIEVADDGPGIPADRIPRIFDPFFTTKATGRGLGLAAVLGIVRNHRGVVSVRSNPGWGTTFLVLLPADHNLSPRQLGSRTTPRNTTQRATVLVVDDEEAVRRLAAGMVTKLGLNAIEASGGSDALVQLERDGEHISCVLLDVTMPDMTGIEVLHEIRKTRPALPVILTSGYTAEDTIDPDESGPTPSAFLQKPYRLQRLEEVLSIALKETSPA